MQRLHEEKNELLVADWDPHAVPQATEYVTWFTVACYHAMLRYVMSRHNMLCWYMWCDVSIPPLSYPILHHFLTSSFYSTSFHSSSFLITYLLSSLLLSCSSYAHPIFTHLPTLNPPSIYNLHLPALIWNASILLNKSPLLYLYLFPCILVLYFLHPFLFHSFEFNLLNLLYFLSFPYS